MKIQLSALSSGRIPFQTFRLRGMSTHVKLWGSFGLVLALMVIMGVVGVLQTYRSARLVDEVVVIQTQKTALALEWNGLANSNAARISSIALTNDLLVKTLFKKDIEETSARINNIIDQLNNLPLNPEEHETGEFRDEVQF